MIVFTMVMIRLLMPSSPRSGTFKTWMKDRQAAQCPETLGDIEALAGVRSYPVRVKCALLAWTTLEHALAGD